MANGLTAVKEQTAKFVHDAVETETAVLTLDRAMAECEKRKKELQSEATFQSQECTAAKNKVDEAKQEIDSLKPFPAFPEFVRDLENERRRIQTKRRAEFISILPRSILFTVIGWAVSAILILAILLDASDSATSDKAKVLTDVLAVAGLCLMPAVITLFFQVSKICKAFGAYKKSIRDSRELTASDRTLYEYRLKNRKYYQECLSKEYTAAQAEWKHLTDQYQNTLNHIVLLDSQLSDLRAKHTQIQSTLSQFYNLGVIPPEYRTLDCAIVLDHYFRNDLVDTMREAILMYREDVKHDIIMEGKDKICAISGNLSAGTVMLERQLSIIDSNVKRISQDLYTFFQRIARGQERQQKAATELLNETQMSRYAAERVAESAKKLEWHKRRLQDWV